MIVVKAAPGLDPDNILGKLLGDAFQVIEFDASRPLRDQAKQAHVLLLRDVPVTAEVMDAAPNLKLLQRHGQHVVGVDREYAHKKNIPVARAPVVLSQADKVVAEHALFLMLALAKRYPEGLAAIKEGALGRPILRTLIGKTLGMVGLGKTGEELARLVAPFGMRVISVKRSADAELARSLGIEINTMDGLDALLEQSDYVSIHLPLEPATVKFVSAARLARMKKGAYLINIARGPIVDQAALYDNLISGHLGGAGLDVFEVEPIDPADPLLGLPNVIVTPHVAGASEEMQQRLAELSAANIRLVAAGKMPLHLLEYKA
jgi:D-3-phosphoglycerate dehydrogenase